MFGVASCHLGPWHRRAEQRHADGIDETLRRTLNVDGGNVTQFQAGGESGERAGSGFQEWINQE